jgi:chorismate dehydratase
MKPTKKILGAVSYLNTVPLIYCFEDLLANYSLKLDYPSRLSDSLGRGEMDCALIPTIEVLGALDYQVVSDACIGCRGPVWSVKILCRRPINEIRSIAFDEGSRTSIALCRILLERYWKVLTTTEILPVDADFRTSAADAVMIIGDRAMQEDQSFPYQFDLGQVWNEWTGLPFVFAVWAARPEANMAYLDRELSVARDKGLHVVEQIIAKYHAGHDLSVAQCRQYLTGHLNYYLGDEERDSMRRFAQLAAELSLISPQSKLNFYDCQFA